MKKTLLAFSLMLLLASCQTSSDKPTPPTQPEAKKYDVTFTTGFATTVTNFSVGRKTTNGVNQPVSGNIDNLYYRIYNSTGTQVNSIDQASTVTGFGTIADKLPAGTYNVFFAGSKGSLYMMTGVNTSFSAAGFSTNSSIWNDTFFSQFSLTVGTNAVTQNVAMDRVIGAVDVTLTDAIPANAKKITLVFSNYPYWFYLNGNSGGGGTQTIEYSLSATDAGVKNKVFSAFAGPTSATIPTTTSVTIRAYDSTNGLIAEKTVSDVPVYRNKRTAISGTLFPAGTGSQNAGFTVTVNTDWGTPPTPITF